MAVSAKIQPFAIYGSWRQTLAHSWTGPIYLRDELRHSCTTMNLAEYLAHEQFFNGLTHSKKIMLKQPCRANAALHEENGPDDGLEIA